MMKIREMPRRPHALFHDFDTDSMTADQIIDSGESDRIDTGLLDAAGNPIYRRRDRVKLGFAP
jgi:hypothetical protein